MKEGTMNRAPTRKVQKSATDGTISATLSNAGACPPSPQLTSSAPRRGVTMGIVKSE
jgi:hypothetical protein